MRHELDNGKVINISDSQIKNFMDNLELSEAEAIQMWLDDNGYDENDEQKELDEKAKSVKIDHGASADRPKSKGGKPRTIKISDAKKELFTKLSYYLNEFCEENNAEMTVLTENKLIEVRFGGEIFKIDLVQRRKQRKT